MRAHRSRLAHSSSCLTSRRNTSRGRRPAEVVGHGLTQSAKVWRVPRPTGFTFGPTTSSGTTRANDPVDASSDRCADRGELTRSSGRNRLSRRGNQAAELFETLINPGTSLRAPRLVDSITFTNTNPLSSVSMPRSISRLRHRRSWRMLVLMFRPATGRPLSRYRRASHRPSAIRSSSVVPVGAIRKSLRWASAGSPRPAANGAPITRLTVLANQHLAATAHARTAPPAHRRFMRAI